MVVQPPFMVCSNFLDDVENCFCIYISRYIWRSISKYFVLKSMNDVNIASSGTPSMCWPYCHSGLIICLLIKKKCFQLSVVTCGPISQDRFPFPISRHFFFVFHLSLTSRVIPEYLVSLTSGIGFSLIICCTSLFL